VAKTHRSLVIMLTAVVLTAASAAANVAIDLNGTFSIVVVRPSFVSMCPAGGADECGVMQLVGLGTADWAYVFGPTFEPSGRCFDVDGTFTITLHSDGSTISGPLTGVFCPGPSATGHQHRSSKSYGNPFFEDDIIHFANGTGQFEGLEGTASVHTFSAGAVFRGTLTGTLSQ
jgi:hypothetical protein